jgi:hypothetical protein
MFGVSFASLHLECSGVEGCLAWARWASSSYATATLRLITLSGPDLQLIDDVPACRPLRDSFTSTDNRPAPLSYYLLFTAMPR